MSENTNKELHLKLNCVRFRAGHSILLQYIIPMPVSLWVVCKVKCNKIKKKKKKY